MNKLILSLTTAFFFCAVNLSVGQNAPQKTFTEKLDGIRTSSNELTKNISSDAASIGQDGGMSTSVPLVTITSRTMSIPIQLNYSSGIKVDDKSGPVGLGWTMPIGSITRDFGAFEPDYSSTSGERTMAGVGNAGWLNSFSSAQDVNPIYNNEFLGYPTVDEVEGNMPLSDLYHVSLPGMGSNSFWNGGAMNQAHDWNWSEFQPWTVEHTTKTYVIDQEYSRINEYNRFHCPNCDNKTHFGTQNSYAAAIGVLPYVINGKAYFPGIPGSIIEKVEYEDFKSFIITTADGTRYVFGRGLRGQKYVFTDNPYWSASADITTAAGNDSPRGSFWKIDYIAEWLLTEILSPDYEDLNQNGIADDADAGDWVRFEYTEPTKEECGIPIGAGICQTTTVPTHREWSSFSQTDRASSLMRELAYVKRIVTPVQTIDFTISERFDVDHDYFGKPANKRGNEFYYEDRHFSSNGSGGSPNDFDVYYPVETMKYDTIKVQSKLIDKLIYPNQNSMTRSVVLDYAQKGSSEELAVSDYLIRNNDDQAKKKTNGQDLGTPSDTGFDISDYNNGTDKRGKTTLIGVQLFGGDLSETDKTEYKFEYAYNPSYSEIHKRHIVKSWAYPSIRQSETLNTLTQNFKATAPIAAYEEARVGSNGLSLSPVNHANIQPNNFLINFPYAEKYYHFSFLSESQMNQIIWNNPDGYQHPLSADLVNQPLNPVQDELGYFYGEDCEVCPTAWSLTKITYPTGGIVSFQYEPAPYDPVFDRERWGFDEKEMPLIAPYNELAKKRSIDQDAYNQYATLKGCYPLPQFPKKKTLTATFELEIPDYCGIRLKSKSIDDRINPVVTVNYEYGNLHFTSLPSEIVRNYVSGFSNFITRERERHSWERSYALSLLLQYLGYTDYIDYDEKMLPAAIVNINVDEYRCTRFYEYVDEIMVDGSFVRSNYAPVAYPLDDPSKLAYHQHAVYCVRNPLSPKNGRFLLTGSNLYTDPIVMNSTEFFELGVSTPYRTESFIYGHEVLASRTLSFDYGTEDNSYQLWSNQFEIWLPIYGNNTPMYYAGLQSELLLGPFTTPSIEFMWDNYYGIQNGPAFAYDKGHFTTLHLDMEYPGPVAKWGTTKTALYRKTTDYRGMITSTDFFYNTNYQIQKEVKSGVHTDEHYITVYKYANEAYSGITNVFANKNMLNALAEVVTYLDAVDESKVFSANVTTYDYTSFVIPRPNHTYIFETSDLNSDGTFDMTPFDFTGGANPDWKEDLIENLEYNRAGRVLSQKERQLYTKNVYGNAYSSTKATIVFPEYKFDATYTGFEDFTGKALISQWNENDYKEEKWFSAFETELDEPAVSFGLPNNPCGVEIPENVMVPGLSRYVNHIMVDNITNLVVGDVVKVELFGNENSIPENYYWSTETEIASILISSDYFTVSPGYEEFEKDYILCFTEPIVFPGSEVISDDNIGGFTNVPMESGEYTISETKITKKLRDHYKLSSGYKRTGRYSCQLRSKRNTTDNHTQTPIRPVKIYEDYLGICEPGEPTMNPDGSISYPFVPIFCDRNYEASLWLIHSSDIPSIPAQGSVPAVSNDPNADAIYRRGTVTEVNNESGFKIVCDVYNADRTQLVDQKIFYPEGVDGNWRQYKVNMGISRQSDYWLDVYVVNERDQVGQPFLSLKSLFVDDIVIYPKGAKYDYSTIDKFGSLTFTTDNNDVFSKNTFDEKGRPIAHANVYGTITSQLAYFEHPVNWTSQNNHFTERVWLNSGGYSETRHYLDGFGKPKQIQLSDASRNVRVAISTYEYDGKGKVIKEYKPYAIKKSVLTNKFHTIYDAKTADFYNSNHAFTEVSYESTPESQVAAIFEPRYDNESAVSSTQNEFLNTTQLTNAMIGYDFLPGQLMVNEMVNAEGKITRTYTDNLGRVVMEEHQIGYMHQQDINGAISFDTQSADTYAQTWFKYDKAGRITDVWDPEGKHSHYIYNSLGVLIESVIPDRGTSKMRYDKYGQVRFIQNQKDIDASLLNGMAQFKYIKYDEWGRVIESGLLEANNSCTTCPQTDFFSDATSIDDQEFPVATNKLVQVHVRYKFDGDREQFNSNSLVEESVYSNHQLGTGFVYTPLNTDVKRYFYMADGQVAKTEFEYSGLPGIHTFENGYNLVGIRTSKNYVHPSNSNYNFQWYSTLDNFGRVTENRSQHNGVTTINSKYYYDVIGNKLMTGLGNTGNSTNPHYDYVASKLNIRGQVTKYQSKRLRIGLYYDRTGNIIAQSWNNEHFDGNTGLNRYEYSYDKMNRLIGADYISGSFSSNPFLGFDNQVVSIPNDFICGANISMLNTVVDPIIEAIEESIPSGSRNSLEQDAINNLNQLKVHYRTSDITYSTLNTAEQDEYLTHYFSLLTTMRLDPISYELYQAIENNDLAHKADLQNGAFTIRKFKYTHLLLHSIPYVEDVDCDPNVAATSYGFLSDFPHTDAINSTPKYDAAYWYEKNGNLTILNRADELGDMTIQDYSYNVPENNWLTDVQFTDVTSTSIDSYQYQYDAVGNLLNDARNGVTNIDYISYNDMPQKITNSLGTKQYRYNSSGSRSFKEVSPTEKMYYVEDVVLDMNGDVMSYQTADGYATPYYNGSSISVNYFYYVKDWLGTNRSVLDNNGNTVNASDHYPFGLRMPDRAFVSDVEGNRYQFTGHEHDGETNYDYHGARYYNAELGRYMSTDPILKYHESPYVYAGDNPVCMIDVNGEDTIYVIQKEVEGKPGLYQIYFKKTSTTGPLVVYYPEDDPNGPGRSDFKEDSYEYHLMHVEVDVSDMNSEGINGRYVRKKIELWDAMDDHRWHVAGRENASYADITYWKSTALFHAPDKTGVNDNEMMNYGSFDQTMNGVADDFNNGSSYKGLNKNSNISTDYLKIMVVGYHSFHTYKEGVDSGGQPIVDPETDEKNKQLADSRAINTYNYTVSLLNESNQSKVDMTIGGQNQQRCAEVIIAPSRWINMYKTRVPYNPPTH